MSILSSLSRRQPNPASPTTDELPAAPAPSASAPPPAPLPTPDLADGDEAAVAARNLADLVDRSLSQLAVLRRALDESLVRETAAQRAGQQLAERLEAYAQASRELGASFAGLDAAAATLAAGKDTLARLEELATRIAAGKDQIADRAQERIDAEQRRIDEVLASLHARTDALIDQQHDRIDRWQDEQEARLEQALADQQARLDLQVAQLGAAAQGSDGSIQQAAQRALACVTDAQRGIEHAASQAKSRADAAVRDIHGAVDHAAVAARQAAASITEGLAHHSASLASRAEDHITRIRAGLDRAAHIPALTNSLRSLCDRAERLSGLPSPDAPMPAHEAPAPWPAAPVPGSLAELIHRAETVLAPSRALANDLARQAHAGQTVRDDLKCIINDGTTALRGHRDHAKKLRTLVRDNAQPEDNLNQVLTRTDAESVPGRPIQAPRARGNNKAA